VVVVAFAVVIVVGFAVVVVLFDVVEVELAWVVVEEVETEDATADETVVKLLGSELEEL